MIKHSVATQPIASWDWSPDKEGLAVCTSFDQTLRILICTKLNFTLVDNWYFAVVYKSECLRNGSCDICFDWTLPVRIGTKL